jgi:hypothetical protein
MTDTIAVSVLREILQELKGLRKDFKAQQVVDCIAGDNPVNFDELFRNTYFSTATVRQE